MDSENEETEMAELRMKLEEIGLWTCALFYDPTSLTGSSLASQPTVHIIAIPYEHVFARTDDQREELIMKGANALVGSYNSMRPSMDSQLLREDSHQILESRRCLPTT